MDQRQQLKIGLLIDSEAASTDVYNIAEWGQRQINLVISHLIIHKPQKTTNQRLDGTTTSLEKIGRGLAQSSFEFLTKAEHLRLTRTDTHKDHVQLRNLKGLVPNCVYVTPQLPAEDCTYSTEDIALIKSLDLDLIVTCAFGLLRGEILKSSRLGILALQYGGAQTTKGGPPGFWEVYSEEEATEFIITQLTEEPASDQVLMEGRLPTKHYYLLNQATLYKRSSYYLSVLLSEIAATGTLPAAKLTCRRVNPRPTMPNFTAQFVYVSAQVASVAHSLANRFFFRKYDRWGLAFARSDWRTLDLGRANRIRNPVDHFLADPFAVTYEGKDFCFAEDYDFSTGKGSITVYELKDATAERLGEAIVEPFHMSFPYLFRFGGRLYMCPETSANEDIRLYECVKFPLEWKLFKILMTDVDAVDTMIFENDGLWWLFTNIDPLKMHDHSSELAAFYAGNPLTTDWIPHKKNPLLIDSAKGRNGGLLLYQGSIHRVAQRQGFGRYGRSISVNKIEVLTKDDYLERELYSIEPNFFADIEGIHHLHSNNSVSVFDCLQIARTK